MTPQGNAKARPQHAGTPHPKHAAARHTRRWRLTPRPAISALLALVGLSLVMYPSVASWLTQYNQSQIVTDYSSEVEDADPSAHEQLIQARRYNDALNVGALLEPGVTIPTGDGHSANDALNYFDILKANDAGLMARIQIPAIKLDLPIYHGTSDDTLLQGVGHLEGTSLPIGGASTRTVLTAHRGLANAEMFTRLDEVEIGDRFTVSVFGEVLTYEVHDKRVVQPDEREALRVEEGKDLATLVTCTPLGINTHRILVTGHRVVPTPIKDIAKAEARPDIPGFPWWIIVGLGGITLIGLYLWWSGLTPTPSTRKKKTTDAMNEETTAETIPTQAEGAHVAKAADRAVEIPASKESTAIPTTGADTTPPVADTVPPVSDASTHSNESKPCRNDSTPDSGNGE